MPAHKSNIVDYNLSRTSTKLNQRINEGKKKLLDFCAKPFVAFNYKKNDLYWHISEEGAGETRFLLKVYIAKSKDITLLDLTTEELVTLNKLKHPKELQKYVVQRIMIAQAFFESEQEPA